MTVRDDIRRALYDAIGWQEGLIDAYKGMPTAPERLEAIAQMKRYKAILKRRYGSAEFLCVQMQGGTPTLWFMCDPKEYKVRRTIKILPTGAEFNEADLGRHIGTFQEAEGALVWHVFEEA